MFQDSHQLMETLAQELALYLLDRLKESVSISHVNLFHGMLTDYPSSCPPSSRLCVGISGVPGAGKVSAHIVDHADSCRLTLKDTLDNSFRIHRTACEPAIQDLPANRI